MRTGRCICIVMQPLRVSPHNWTSVFVCSIHSLDASVHWIGSRQLLMHVSDAPGVGPASWQTLTPQSVLSLEPFTVLRSPASAVHSHSRCHNPREWSMDSLVTFLQIDSMQAI